MVAKAMQILSETSSRLHWQADLAWVAAGKCRRPLPVRQSWTDLHPGGRCWLSPPWSLGEGELRQNTEGEITHSISNLVWDKQRHYSSTLAQLGALCHWRCPDKKQTNPTKDFESKMILWQKWHSAYVYSEVFKWYHKKGEMTLYTNQTEMLL